MSLAEETEAGASPASRLLELIDEQVPAERAGAVRAFASAYLRRLSGDASEGISAEDLVAEVVGAFEFASARGDEPVAVRAFNPTREPSTATSRSARCWRPTATTGRSSSTRCPASCEGARPRRDAPAAPDRRRRARRQGRIAAVGRAREAPHRESVMHFDLARRLDDAELAERRGGGPRACCSAVREVVADFKAMTERVDDMITVARAGTARYPRDEVHEVADFLEWLLKGNFVLLGAREYDFTDGDDPRRRRLRPRASCATRTGRRTASRVPLADLPPAVRERATSGDLLLVTKTNAISPVHRHERMDYVGVRLVSRSGEIVGESRLLGLFTSKAFAERASETPLLHRKLRQALDAEDLIEGSHDYKAAVALFDSFPKEELFAAPVDDLRRAVVALTGARGLGPRPPARPPRRRRAQRVADPRRCRARATAPRSSRA